MQEIFRLFLIKPVFFFFFPDASKKRELFIHDFVILTPAVKPYSLLGPFALRLPRSGHIRHEKTVPKCRRKAIPLQRIGLYCRLPFYSSKLASFLYLTKFHFFTILSLYQLTNFILSAHKFFNVFAYHSKINLYFE